MDEQPTPETDDTEGHGVRHIVQPVEDDTAGHGSRFFGVQPAEDDTEAHSAKIHGLQPVDRTDGPQGWGGGTGRSDDDDTEGHGISGRF